MYRSDDLHTVQCNLWDRKSELFELARIGKITAHALLIYQHGLAPENRSRGHVTVIVDRSTQLRCFGLPFPQSTMGSQLSIALRSVASRVENISEEGIKDLLHDDDVSR